MLINTVGLLSGLWNPVPSWCENRQLLGKTTLKYAWRWLVLEWQGVWKCLGKCQSKILVSWDFTLQQAKNPGKLVLQLTEGCLAYPSKNQQLLALCWGLPCAGRVMAHFSLRTVVKAGTKPPLAMPRLSQGSKLHLRTPWLRQRLKPHVRTPWLGQGSKQ